MNQRIILASGSPRRALVLRNLGLKFSVVPSKVDERSVRTGRPSAYVRRLAITKAKDVSERVGKGIIIGADTMVVLKGRLLGKPKDWREAFRMLRSLSGRAHVVITGVCVINRYTGEKKTFVASTRIRFRKLSDSMIRWYIGTEEPMDKAGAYAIQGKGAVLVDRIDGDYYNVMGLPLASLAKVLEDMEALRYP